MRKKMIHFYCLEFPVLTLSEKPLPTTDKRVIEVLKRILGSDRFWKYFQHSGTADMDDYSIEQQLTFDFDLVDIDEHKTGPLTSPLKNLSG